MSNPPVTSNGRRAPFAVLIACALMCIAFLALLVGCNQEQQPSGDAQANSKLAIIHTNDVHGNVNAGEGVLGLAAVAQLKTDYEGQGYDVVLLDAGDALQGALLANNDQGESIIKFMGEVGYDAMALGNHEFDYGADVLEQRIESAAFSVLAANVTVDATGEFFAGTNAVIETASGVRVGVFGLDAPSTKSQSSPKNTVGISFARDEELYSCAQAQIDDLRAQGCTVVVCLGHLGEESLAEGSTSRDVIEHTKGLDIFIDAHDHEVKNKTVDDAEGKSVLLVETGSNLANIGVLTWNDGAWEEQLVSAEEYEGADQTIASEIGAYADGLDQQLSEVAGTTTVELDGNRAPGNRDRETNFGDLIADAMLWQAKQAASKAPDAAIVNGGGIRAGIKPGDITLRDVHDVLPFNNQMVTVTVTGAQLLEALEAATQVLPEQEGAFPQVAGISFTVDTTVPYAAGELYPDTTFAAPAEPGTRVTIEDVGGRRFDLQDSYVIATSDFIAMGGDAYYVFAEAAQDSLEYLGYVDYQAFQHYLADELGGAVSDTYAEPQGRITIKQ